MQDNLLAQQNKPTQMERIRSSRFYKYTTTDELPVKALAVCSYEPCGLQLDFPRRQSIRFYVTYLAKEPVHRPQQESLPPDSCFHEIADKPSSALGHAVAKIVRHCQHRGLVKQIQ